MARRGRRGKKNWIAGATPPSTKGALHRQLGVSESQPIPAAKLAAAASSDNELLAKRARLAQTLKKLHGGG